VKILFISNNRRNNMNGMLDGVKVIDLSTLLPGPFCTQMLGDLGADIIKIEAPPGGDPVRFLPPRGKAESGQFLAVNRNKRSIKLDLRQEEGKEVFLKLVADADVVVVQYRPGVMERLGLGYEILRQHNPRIIMCSITGYGQDGPLRDKAGHDINFLSTTGILDLIGNYQDNPAIPAIRVAGVGGGALWAAFSIMAALFAREKTGLGQHIDVSMTDTVFTFMTMIAGSYFMDYILPRRGKESHNGGRAWYSVYKTKDDRYIALGMFEAKFWEKFCNAIGRPDYIPNKDAPWEVQEKMKQELSELFATRTVDEWMEILDPLDICVSKVKNIEEAIADAHLNKRGMIIELDHPAEGKIRSLGFPVKFSEQPYTVRMAPPTLGQHTEEILQEIGYTMESIEKLRAKGVL
jgi:crotonobetainyl-CoA:carnitine CoA-transferase CaiB-like acyl-CoA transferase